MNMLTRRLFLKSTPAALAVGTAVAAPPAIEAGHAATVDLTAIPAEVVEKIKAWQEAHRLYVRTSKAYAASTQASPIDKAESDRCFDEMRTAADEVGPAREAMIFALWRV